MTSTIGRSRARLLNWCFENSAFSCSATERSGLDAARSGRWYLSVYDKLMIDWWIVIFKTSAPLRFTCQLVELAKRLGNQLSAAGRTTSTNIGRRAFRCSAPEIWNTLPYELRSASCIGTFRRSLKRIFSNSLDFHDTWTRKLAPLKSSYYSYEKWRFINVHVIINNNNNNNKSQTRYMHCRIDP